jgi:hypothetical protein
MVRWEAEFHILGNDDAVTQRIMRGSVVKFTLVYEGPLPPDGKTAVKWDIRKYFSPQLKELWELHPSLKDAARRRFISRDQPGTFYDIHHFADDQKAFTQVPSDNDIDLCAAIERKDRKF